MASQTARAAQPVAHKTKAKGHKTKKHSHDLLHRGAVCGMIYAALRREEKLLHRSAGNEPQKQQRLLSTNPTYLLSETCIICIASALSPHPSTMSSAWPPRKINLDCDGCRNLSVTTMDICHEVGIAKSQTS